MVPGPNWPCARDWVDLVASAVGPATDPRRILGRHSCVAVAPDAVSGSFETSAQLSHRFGQTARLVVPGLILAGHIMAWLLLGGLAALFSTSYGLALVCKQDLAARRSAPRSSKQIAFHSGHAARRSQRGAPSDPLKHRRGFCDPPHSDCISLSDQ